MKHGVILPHSKSGIRMPGTVISTRSRKRVTGTRIRLDRLLRLASPKICIKRRIGGIGDILMITPAIKALKSLLPHSHITCGIDTEYASGALIECLSHCPYVDTIISYADVADNEYDYCVDVTSSALHRERSGMLPPSRIDLFAEDIGVDISESPLPVYLCTGDERKMAYKTICHAIPDRNQDTKIIGIQTRSADSRRTWPATHVQELCDMLAEQPNTHVLIFDWGKTVDTWVGGKRKHLMMDLSWSETSALVEQCDLIVCPNSAMVHIAGAFNKKTVMILGPTPPTNRFSHYINASSVYHELPCSNCWFSPRCIAQKTDQMKCLTGITPEEVLEAVKERLNEPEKQLSDSDGDPNYILEKPYSILVKCTTKQLENILTTTPGLKALKNKYDSTNLHFACQPEMWSAVQHNPYIDTLLDINRPLAYGDYDMFVDISDAYKMYRKAVLDQAKPIRKNKTEVYITAMGINNRNINLKPTYFPTQAELLAARQLIDNNSKPNLALALYDTNTYRSWPESHYNKLIKTLKDTFNIFLLSHPDKYYYEENINNMSCYNFRENVALMSLCDGLVTVDTDYLYCAAAIEMPMIALFGPTDCKIKCKGYSNTTILVSDISCAPCVDPNKCKYNNPICMSNISHKQVAQHIKTKFLSKDN